jgi:hypothetical protein
MTNFLHHKSAPDNVRNLADDKPFPTRKLSVREAAALQDVEKGDV